MIEKLNISPDGNHHLDEPKERPTQKFVVLFRKPVQIAPEDWEVRTETKLCNEQTTIGEILNWYKSKLPNAKLYCEIVEAE